MLNYRIIIYLLINRYCKVCTECNNKIHSKNISGYCHKCISKYRKQYRKVQWPTKEELSANINTMSWIALGKKYGVSNNAVKKWAKKIWINLKKGHHYANSQPNRCNY